jgi:hypothetical protein
MTRHVFPYTDFQGEVSEAFPDGSKALRPVLHFFLSKGARSVTGHAFVDSGADYCTFPGVWMAALGIDRSEARLGSNLFSPIGSAPIFFCEVTMALPFTEPYPLYAGFAESMNNWNIGEEYMGIFGQVGFFDRFKVMFDARNNSFEIET